jgi:hypothetical protein
MRSHHSDIQLMELVLLSNSNVPICFAVSVKQTDPREEFPTEFGVSRRENMLIDNIVEAPLGLDQKLFLR